MTREEAIQWLTDIKENITENWSHDVAIDMAIEALQAEQTEYKLPGHDEVMEALDNMKLEFTINGKERIKRIGGDND